jgi:hypothetical protein
LIEKADAQLQQQEGAVSCSDCVRKLEGQFVSTCDLALAYRDHDKVVGWMRIVSVDEQIYRPNCKELTSHVKCEKRRTDKKQ